MAKEIELPDQLKILQSDMNKGIIVVGNKGYEITPLNEGQFERILADIIGMMEKVSSPDGRCSQCGRVIKEALPKKILKCPDDGSDLMTMNRSPMEVIVGSGRIPAWVQIITGIPEEEVKANMTLDQLQHFAGLFWKLNFSGVGLPEESKENFKNLQGTMRGKPEKQKKEAAPAEITEGQPPQ